MKRFWRWLTRADKREREWQQTRDYVANLERMRVETERAIRENRAEAWRTLADLERRGILTPTAKYRTLEWLTNEYR